MAFWPAPSYIEVCRVNTVALAFRLSGTHRVHPFISTTLRGAHVHSFATKSHSFTSLFKPKPLVVA
jgi:hypothetical protein